MIGLPGEVVSEQNGFFYVDGRKLAEPYLDLLSRDSVTKRWPQLGAKQYFVMGDNRDNSRDSRVWGFVPYQLIKGRALVVWWSRDPSRGGLSPQGVADWFTSIRWRRFFQRVD